MTTTPKPIKSMSEKRRELFQRHIARQAQGNPPAHIPVAAMTDSEQTAYLLGKREAEGRQEAAALREQIKRLEAANAAQAKAQTAEAKAAAAAPVYNLKSRDGATSAMRDRIRELTAAIVPVVHVAPPPKAEAPPPAAPEFTAHQRADLYTASLRDLANRAGGN